MKTIAIISEYNPFHNGHLHQLIKIREEFGNDAAIISIMSGNYTQRGEIAFFDKWDRAKAAVKEGVNLVVEIPFPFSASSAEFYAKSGVKIATELGAEYISFGSECGNISELQTVSENMLSDAFQSAFRENLKSKDNKGLGYARIAEETYNQFFGAPPFSLSGANNILALEYIKAIKLLKSHLKIHTVRRTGAQYNEQNLIGGSIQSATFLRTALMNDFNSASEYIPQNSFSVICDTKDKGEFPCLDTALSGVIISHFRLKRGQKEYSDISSDIGLYNRLKNNSIEANDIQSLINLTDTKKYTDARIRRVIWYSIFGVTSSDLAELPKYTQVLAMDKVGQAILKKAKKTTDFPILTKPSAIKQLNRHALRQKTLSDTADSIFELTKPTLKSGNQSLIRTPYILE